MERRMERGNTICSFNHSLNGGGHKYFKMSSVCMSVNQYRMVISVDQSYLDLQCFKTRGP